jgi:hypothetical protein
LSRWVDGGKKPVAQPKKKRKRTAPGKEVAESLSIVSSEQI